MSAVLEDLNECEEEEEAEVEFSDVSSKPPYSSHKPSKLQFTFPETKVPVFGFACVPECVFGCASVYV